MALSAKLELRQGQQLIMTPQLQQAIKLLQLSNYELAEFVETELERNPLLEREDAPAGSNNAELADADDNAPQETDGNNDGNDESWLELGHANLATTDLDTDYENVYADTLPSEIARETEPSWSGLRSYNGYGHDTGQNLEAFASKSLSLKDHLIEHLQVTTNSAAELIIGRHIIDLVDEAGYIVGDLSEIARKLSVDVALVHLVLEKLQTTEPTGIPARNLAECLRLQLKERNRYDPIIAGLLDNLHLLASHDLIQLRRAVRVNAEELSEMIQELKALDPKPGLRFGSVTVQPIVPDVIVRSNRHEGWSVELNSETLPRVLLDRSYYATVSKGTRSDGEKDYLHNCLQTANWLVKSLDQRARTILRVSQEIVRQQDGFFAKGVQHLRPLNLKAVADAISVHESTVSRVTSNKYMATPRGIVELRYFFSSAISGALGGDCHSSEAVRYRIKALIEAESVDSVLSDDKIVDLLRSDGVDIARRTVAKYREAMRIPSSVLRRRQKRLAHG
ncbi:MAG: RNA polymerase factor sigma-54 [Hyphomicrobiaceae bacterium]